MNAFATGPRRNSALVAVGTGLLRNMRNEEVEAVLAHEVSHVANGDMAALALVQGVVNTFVIFLSRLAALPESLEAFGISGRQGGGIKRLLMSHPPIPQRIAALQKI